MVRNVGIAFLIAAIAGVDEPPPNSLNAAEQKLGFKLLFDGQSLDGWDHAGNWRATRGAIFRAGPGGNIIHKGRVPDDFELRFEWKVSAGANSGIYYRPGQYEYQILDNRHADGRNPRTSAGSLYFCMPPSKDVTRPVGDWNEGRVICQGSVIQHWLNGEKVIDFDYAEAKWAKEVEMLRVRGANLADRGAPVLLQDHGDPVWFRSLRIRVIPSSEKLDRKPVTPMVVSPEAQQREQKTLERFVKPNG